MMTRRLLLGTGAMISLAARNWERDAFPDWSDEHVDKVLTDSPWAQPVKVAFRQLGVSTEIYLTVRWSSALPVRRALALHQYGKNGLGSGKAVELLDGEPAEYVVDVAGFPVGAVAQGARRLEAELLRSAKLIVKGRSAMSAVSASVPEHGNHLIATVRFRRFENLLESEGFIELSAQAGPMVIHSKFKLREMNYKGRLEL